MLKSSNVLQPWDLCTEAPVHYQNDTSIQTTNLTASRLYEILRWDILLDTESPQMYSSTAVSDDRLRVTVIYHNIVMIFHIQYF